MTIFGADVHWGSFDNWIYLLLLIPIAAVIIMRVVRKKRTAQLLAHRANARTLIGNYSFSRQLIKAILLIVGATFLMATLLRPQWGMREQKLEHRGRDVLIALDISGSMLCQDVAPNRLAFAKKKISTLIKKLSCERVGLMLFSGSPFIICPLTHDYESFFMFLNQVDGQTISSSGTSMDKAIRMAIDMYKKMPERKNKLLILLTDGEDFSSEISHFKQEAAAAGITIFAVGLGTADGAPVPLFNNQAKLIGHQKNKDGSVVISRLDEKLLQELVDSCGGIYVHATENNSDVATIVEKLESFQKEKIDERKTQLYQDKYHHFAIVSFICFLLAWLL